MPTRLASGLMAMVAAAPTATAGSHLWDFVEVFSNADGSIQYIELEEELGANFETNLDNKSIFSLVTGNVFTFDVNLIPPTGFKNLLLATEGYARLPGAPTPDFIIPDNFFAVGGDTLRYHIYDQWTFGPGALPLDCVSSLNRDLSTGRNNPENYAGVIGAIDACPCPGDLNIDGEVGGADLGQLLVAWGGADAAADLTGDGLVDGADLGQLLFNWGACP
jgi:hypothetical protein